MKKFKEEDFQIGDVFENKAGSRYEIVEADSTYIFVKYTHGEIEQILQKARKNFEYYLNKYNSWNEHNGWSQYPFYKVA